MTAQYSQALEAFTESIQNTEAWQAWRQAQQSLENDAPLLKLFERYDELSSAMNQSKAQGGGLTGEQIVELAQVRDEILSNPAYVCREEASQELTELFRDTNSLLTKSLGIDFAATAAPQSGCCG